MGALDVYGDKPNCFDDEAEVPGCCWPRTRRSPWRPRTIENLHTAIDSRDLIGQADGVLMERYKISAARAFELNVMSSQATHRRVRIVADHLVATGELLIRPPKQRRQGS